ncbi:MAG: ABC transporter ATP-binding protein [Desulfarculus sp.]|jgi:branched-chain amino acid transport system ATP-binding protein|nr:MAG: ABC transporter ATP-binding protein [Desulfarculus sp.]
MEPMLTTIGLTKNFGGLTAVNNVNFSIYPGDAQSIIGPNGAGKSTFFKLISGEIKPSRGKIMFNGKDITKLPQTKVSHRGIAVAYQITNIFPLLTVFENVRVAAQSRKTTFNFWSKAESHSEISDQALHILEEIGLIQFRHDIAANLSHGDQKRLEIGIALATKPELLLLDEPTAGLSPTETRQTIELIKNISEHLTIILVEHKMTVVMEVSDKITVLHYGSLLAQGSPEDIRNNEEVRRVYLGGVKM